MMMEREIPGRIAPSCPDESENRFRDRCARRDAGGGIFSRIKAGLFPDPAHCVDHGINLVHDPAAPAQINAEDLQTRILDRLIGSQPREQAAELFDVSGVMDVGIILPAVDVSHQQYGTAGLPNRLHRFMKLIAIPEIALLIKFNKAEPVNIPGGSSGGGRCDRSLGRRFAQMIRLIRSAAGEEKAERAAEKSNPASRA